MSVPIILINREKNLEQQFVDLFNTLYARTLDQYDPATAEQLVTDTMGLLMDFVEQAETTPHEKTRLKDQVGFGYRHSEGGGGSNAR